MKKIMALVLVLCMVLSMAACGAANDSKPAADNKPAAAEAKPADAKTDDSAAPAELKHFKLGMMDPGAWNAHQGPMYAQMEAAAKALNIELVYATADANSGEGHLAALQNLLSAGCDAVILLNMPMVYGIIPQVAQMCDEAGVYWSINHTFLGEGTDNYNACMNSKYFVSTVYEDDVYSATWCGNLLGERDCKVLTEIGFAAGNATGDMRDSGIQAACEKYGMSVVAEERDNATIRTSDGGKNATDRFIAGYPDMDGIVVAGMAQFCLSGVVSSLEEAKKIGEVKVSCIDFHEFQTEYLESGAIDGIIGGHVCGPLYSLVLIANIMNGTPLTEEKCIIKGNFIELASFEDAQNWDKYGKDGKIYSAEEIQNMMVVNNPSFTYDDLMKIVDTYSLDDIMARANG